MSGPIRIFVVDDQPLIRDGLSYILDHQDDMTVVGSAGTVHAAIEGCENTVPDVALLDIRLSDGSGLDVARHLVSHMGEPPKILLITTFDDSDYVLEALRAGAMGYVLKDLPTPELLATVRAVYRGEAMYRTQAASWAISQVLSATPAPPPLTHRDRLMEPLTDREREVLQRMAQGERNQDIARALYLSEGTVKTHVHSILQKLGTDDRTQAVVWAFRHGLVQ